MKFHKLASTSDLFNLCSLLYLIQLIARVTIYNYLLLW